MATVKYMRDSHVESNCRVLLHATCGNRTHLAAATSATWTSFISRGTVYDTADDLTAEVATGEAPRRVWWLLR